MSDYEAATEIRDAIRELTEEIATSNQLRAIWIHIHREGAEDLDPRVIERIEELVNHGEPPIRPGE